MASAAHTKRAVEEGVQSAMAAASAAMAGGTAGAQGDVYYVDSSNTKSTDTAQGGQTPVAPFATIAYAIGNCTATNGDTIYVLPGHTETVTSAITVNVAGISIIGQGTGTARPTISCATVSIDEMTVTAANCTIEGLYFNEATGTTARTSFINVAAAYCTIRDCHFDMGAYDTEGITIEAAGNHLTIEDCQWQVTADGPDAGIEIESTSDDLVVRRCEFNGGSATNAWDVAAIHGTGANKRTTIEDCIFVYGKTGLPLIDLEAVTEPPVIRNNVILPIGAAAGLANNYNGPADYYVDSRTGNNTTGAGHSWQVPAATIDYAVGLATSSNGDTIHVAAGHTESLTSVATLTVDKTGLTIKGYGNWDNRPTITIDHAKGVSTSGQVTISKPSVTFDNLIFEAGCASFGVPKVLACDEQYFEARNCRIAAPGTNKAECLVELLTTKDYYRFINCEFESTTDPGGTDAAAMSGGIYIVDTNDVYLERCTFKGNFETACIHNKTSACKDLWLRDCVFHGQLATAEQLRLVATSAGGLINCHALTSGSGDVAVANVWGTVGSGVYFYQCYGGNDGGGGQFAAVADATAT